VNRKDGTKEGMHCKEKVSQQEAQNPNANLVPKQAVFQPSQEHLKKTET